MAINKSSAKKAKKIGTGGGTSILGRKKHNTKTSNDDLPYLSVKLGKNFRPNCWLCIPGHPASTEDIWVAQDLQSGEVGLIPRSGGIDVFALFRFSILIIFRSGSFGL